MSSELQRCFFFLVHKQECEEQRLTTSAGGLRLRVWRSEIIRAAVKTRTCLLLLDLEVKPGVVEREEADAVSSRNSRNL